MVRLLPAILLAGFGWLWFGLFRAGLLAANHASLTDVQSPTIIKCLQVGLRYDAVPMGYFLLPLALALLLVPAATFNRGWFRSAVSAYVTAVVATLLLVEAVGFFFFFIFGRRLDWTAVNYLSHGETWGYLWADYPMTTGVVVLVLAIFGLYRLLRSKLWNGGDFAVGWRFRIPLAVATAAVLVLCCRGTLDHKPLDRNRAYLGGNNIVNELSLNNVFSLSDAVLTQVFEKPVARPSARERNIVHSMLYMKDDVNLGAKNPLWRKSVGASEPLDCNVVVILMESMGGKQYVGATGHSPSYTPNLDRICREGLYFENMYATGEHTCRGLTSVLFGFPDNGGRSIFSQPRAMGQFLSLPSYFLRRGYKTMFFYGGNADFDNMEAFLSGAGINKFITQNEITSGPECVWGRHDECVLGKAHETFMQMGSQRFFSVILTVSNHEPFNVPSGRVQLHSGQEDSDRINGFLYADWALGDFFAKASKAPYFKNTIFVLVADHGKFWDWSVPVDVPTYHIPGVIYAPGIIQPQTVKTICSQLDIAPTLLGLMGGPYDHCFTGRDILKVAEDDGYAFLQERDDGRCALVRKGAAIIAPANTGPFLVDPATNAPLKHPDAAKVQLMHEQARALQHMTHWLWYNGLHAMPANYP